MRKVLILLSALWSATAVAQVPVVEAGTNAAGNRGRISVPASSGGNELMVTMYNQLEALQQEVQTLRGRVEEQDYMIKRMQTEQRDRYLDIDRRLSTGNLPADIGAAPAGPSAIPGLSAGPQAIPSAPPPSVVSPIGSSIDSANTVPANTASRQGAQAATPTVGVSTAAVPQMDEQELYRTALNLLLEQSNYEQSIQYFQSYITMYPQGRYLTNSYYWQGEAYILVGKFREAREVFLKIIDGFPQDPKAAGAMLKLGVVYQQMGDEDRARQTWQEIAVRYPENTTEIREAANHLRGG